jgi:hypothetical protein
VGGGGVGEGGVEHHSVGNQGAAWRQPMAMKGAAEAVQSRQEDEVPEKPSVLREMSGLILTLCAVDEWLHVLRKDEVDSAVQFAVTQMLRRLLKGSFQLLQSRILELAALCSECTDGGGGYRVSPVDLLPLTSTYLFFILNTKPLLYLEHLVSVTVCYDYSRITLT